MPALIDAVRTFAVAREWERFHDPKNLAMALVSEAGELAALLRWVPNSESDRLLSNESERARIEAEVGDIGICLLQFCSRTGIDLGDAILRKLEENAQRYPVEASRGRAERARRDHEPGAASETPSDR